MDYVGVVLPTGDYTIKATPYSLASGGGTAGTSLTINFKITNSANGSSSATNDVPSDSLAEEETPDNTWADTTSVEKVALTNFPNPFRERTTFRFSFAEEQEYTLEIYDLDGPLVTHLKTDIALAGEIIEETWDSSHQESG